MQYSMFKKNFMFFFDVMDKYDGQIYVISVTIISYVTLRILEIFR